MSASEPVPGHDGAGVRDHVGELYPGVCSALTSPAVVHRYAVANGSEINLFRARFVSFARLCVPDLPCSEIRPVPKQ